MLAQLLSLLLFVFNADRMATLFVGAMCAVGTLNANAYGFPTLYAKIAVFFVATMWLILDQADRTGRDYPLTRVKYALVMVIVPLVLSASAPELSYFLYLRADVITSCCSTKFTPETEGIAAEMSGIGPAAALMRPAATGAAVAISGAVSHFFGRGGMVFFAAGAVFFIAALTAIVSVISGYIYEHPNHHCPFCVLKPEYGYFGYALYIPLFLGTAFALGAGALQPFRRIESLSATLPARLRRHGGAALVAYFVFGLVVLWTIYRSQLILFG
ncbi:MAG: hypothetical protein Q8Q63_03905 [Phaeovulum sp.]|uniref:hypothetical protein n=1 Tax=Phaeovulum sp. TaxID=2934796 RepID=UPI00273474CE|nr:hypothetical protein [Phaeovulum sp.]MDP3860711.1 hypothetical protein [Phaeovulum sp.]